MSIEWDSRSRNLESKIIAQHQSLYDEKKNKKKVIGGPAESFSNIVSVDRKVKQACSIGGNLLPRYRRLFLELPRDDGKVLMADQIIGSYNQQNIAVYTKCIFTSSLVRLSRHLEHEKSFKDMTSHDITDRQMYTFQCRDCGQELYLDYKSQVQVVREFHSRQKTAKLA